MEQEISQELLNKYQAHLDSENPKAIDFVQKHYKNSHWYWIEINHIDYARVGKQANTFYSFADIDKDSRYKSIFFTLYPRKHQPNYPEKPKNPNNAKYLEACHLATWITARQDIEEQKNRGYNGYFWKLSLKEPDAYLKGKWKEYNKNVDWDKVPKELKIKLKNDPKKFPLYCEVLEKYSTIPEKTKNNPPEYQLTNESGTGKKSKKNTGAKKKREYPKVKVVARKEK